MVTKCLLTHTRLYIQYIYEMFKTVEMDELKVTAVSR